MRNNIHTNGAPALCVSCEARHRGVCGALEPSQLVELAKSSSRHRLAEGTEVIGDAEAIEGYSNVLSGVVKLTKALSDGRQQIVGLQFAPDFLGRPFGEESDLGIEAATEVLLCSFPRSTIERLLEQSPAMEKRIFLQTLRELDEARQWMLTLGRKSASEKIASFLLLIAQNVDPATGGHPAVSFDLPLSRSEIADYLGLTIETVSRRLTKLNADGVIAIHNRHVMVKSLDQLSLAAGD